MFDFTIIHSTQESSGFKDFKNHHQSFYGTSTWQLVYSFFFLMSRNSSIDLFNSGRGFRRQLQWSVSQAVPQGEKKT